MTPHIEAYQTILRHNIKWFVLTIIFCLVAFGASVVLATTFIILNPRLFRKSTYTDIAANVAQDWEKNKTERTERKRAKLEAEKDRLNAKLEKLDDESKE